MSREKGLMWTERYRPTSLDEVVNHKEVIRCLKELLKNPSDIPHLLFAGPPGNGKTTVALCVARQALGNHWRRYTLELNASDERGIGMVREKIKAFSHMSTIEEVPFRIVILDECEELTPEAQTALRRIMEMSSRTCRFILICNYVSKIIEPIQSRCAIFRFLDLKKKDIAGCLRSIAEKEDVELTDGGIDAIWEFCGGDLRRAINTLQAAAIFGKVDEEAVTKVVGKVRPSDIVEMLGLSLEGRFIEARKILSKLLFVDGIPGTDILRQIHQEVFRLDVPEDEKVMMMELIGECDYRLIEGANEDIQLSALLAKIASIRRA